MNFNLALICTDEGFADARAFRASCSLPPSRRNPHPASVPGALELPSASAGLRYHSWVSTPRPKKPRKWAIVGEMYRVYTCSAVFKNSSNLEERVGSPGASEAEHKSKDTDMDIDINVAEIQRWAQML